MSIKKKILQYMLEPAKNIQSSQTLYEALMANINMYNSTGEEKFKKAAQELANVIIESQLKDGGFDIGYNFKFGEQIKKSSEIQATTPECLSIYALIEYYKIESRRDILTAINKGMNWIKKNSFINEEGFWVIPYAPGTIKEVYITNAISFCIGTIANYSATFHDDSYFEIYHSMNQYMRSQLTIIDENGYWTYFEKKLVKKEGLYSKIDNYHIAQQLYYHMKAECFVTDDANREIIKYVSNYIMKQLERDIAVPYIYINGGNSKIADIDMWGYCALLMCVVELRNLEWAQKVEKVILYKSWNGKYFMPILNDSLEVIDSKFYPRSDAWVVHALSEYYRIERDEITDAVIRQDLKYLQCCHYRGIENHALTVKKEILATVARIYRGIMKSKN